MDVGDYVIADKALYDTFEGRTFKILAFTKNLFGETLAKVQDIATGRKTSFYPSELSREDGS